MSSAQQCIDTRSVWALCGYIPISGYPTCNARLKCIHACINGVYRPHDKCYLHTACSPAERQQYIALYALQTANNIQPIRRRLV